MLVNPIITQVSSTDKRKLCNLSLNHNELGRIDVMTCPKIENPNVLKIQLKNNKESIGQEIIELTDNKKSMFGFDIAVSKNHQKKSVGELLRLVSIMEMFENNKNEIEIYSKPNAIYFHSKYKFEPHINSFFNRDNSLISCIENRCNEMRSEQEEAVKLLEKIRTLTEVEDKRNYCKIVGSFIKRYIEKVLTLPKEQQIFYPFDYGFNMKLTKENVLKNMEFFNKLFKKHGINYKI